MFLCKFSDNYFTLIVLETTIHLLITQKCMFSIQGVLCKILCTKNIIKNTVCPFILTV